MLRTMFLLALLLALSACSDLLNPHHRLTIQATGPWSGSLGGTSSTSSYQGNGSGWIEYWGQVCYVLQLGTDAGSLSARFEETDRGAASTSAAYGVISGCNY